MTQRDFEHVRAVASESALWRWPLAAARAYHSAWSESRLGGWWRQAAVMTTWTAALRVRYAFLVIAWAAAWQVVALTILPGYVLSGLPRGWFAVISAGALMLAAAAPALVHAWHSSAIAALIARFDQKV